MNFIYISTHVLEQTINNEIYNEHAARLGTFLLTTFLYRHIKNTLWEVWKSLKRKIDKEKVQRRQDYEWRFMIHESRTKSIYCQGLIYSESNNFKAKGNCTAWLPLKTSVHVQITIDG